MVRNTRLYHSTQRSWSNKCNIFIFESPIRAKRHVVTTKNHTCRLCLLILLFDDRYLGYESRLITAKISFTLAPWVTQTPPWTAWFLHPPTNLHRLHSFMAPCVIQTPPFWNWLVHPFILHCFLALTFAPCVTQTPPCWTRLGHPSKLHRFLFAPCVTQTPPFTTWLVHPFWLHPFLAFDIVRGCL